MAQVLAYPQKKWMYRFVPGGVTAAPTGFRRTGFASAQKLVEQRKKRVVSTPRPCSTTTTMFFIKDIKEKTKEQPGNPQRRSVQYRKEGAGDGKGRETQA